MTTSAVSISRAVNIALILQGFSLSIPLIRNPLNYARISVERRNMKSTFLRTLFGTSILLILPYIGSSISLAKQNSLDGNELYPRLGKDWKFSNSNLMPSMRKLLERDATCGKDYILCSGKSEYDILLSLCRFAALLLFRRLLWFRVLWIW